jgi:NADPH:quinone reductase-like Zn-dependent oxidoreductase
MTNRRHELVRSETGYDLQRADGVSPEPGPGEVLVKVHAVSINRRDVSVRDLSYPVNGADHFVPGSDAAGEIVSVGEGVTEWKVGDRVASTFFQNWDSGRLTVPGVISSLGAGGPGVLADEIVLSQNGVVRIPDDWSYVEGASLPCAGVTAWTALKTLGQLEAGDWVLIIGTGGVALFALQIAVASGANVVVLSSSDEKLAQAKAMGAQVGINYRTTPEWAAAVKEATGHAGMQHALELGGAGTMERTLASMAIGGHVAMIGALDGFGAQIPGIALVMGALRVSAVAVGPRESHRALIDLMVGHKLRPVIDCEFSFEAAEDAYARSEQGAFGKVVINL